MKYLLDNFLPRLFPELRFRCISHQGKQDLDRNIIKILRSWNEPGIRFVIVRDNDSGDCRALKERLRQLCLDGGRTDTMIRIVCQELEAWYLGDPGAMADAFGDEKLRNIGRRARFRNPDIIAKPSDEVKNLVPQFQKTVGARQMAQHLTREGNRSHSFAVFLNGIAGLVN